MRRWGWFRSTRFLLAIDNLKRHIRSATAVMPTFKSAERRRAIQRGMEFIYGIARKPRHFAKCCDDLLYFFRHVALTAQDRSLRKMARRMANESFSRWRYNHRVLPPDADADTIIEYFHDASTAEQFGLRNKTLKQHLREAAKAYTAADFLWFDPLSEAPPVDVPESCDYCESWNERGRKRCCSCRRQLSMMTRYQVWYYSLTRAYCAESYGIVLGASYSDVFKWLPALRPYRGREVDANSDFADTVYAISHVVYTLNDYGVYRLSPCWLPEEYEFLKLNLKEAIALEDPDMMGEFLDSLMGFGLTDKHPLIRQGMEYLLSTQNRDGSWGDVEAEDLYSRYHPTWAAIDGLRNYAWRGAGLKFPELLPLFKSWARRKRVA